MVHVVCRSDRVQIVISFWPTTNLKPQLCLGVTVVQKCLKVTYTHWDSSFLKVIAIPLGQQQSINLNHALKSLKYSSTWPALILERFSRAGPRGRGREWATLEEHPLTWLLSNNRLEKVPFVSVLHTSCNRLLLSNQDKGCTPSAAHSLPLPLGPALLNLWNVKVYRQVRFPIQSIKMSTILLTLFSTEVERVTSCLKLLKSLLTGRPAFCPYHLWTCQEPVMLKSLALLV